MSEIEGKSANLPEKLPMLTPVEEVLLKLFQKNQSLTLKEALDLTQGRIRESTFNTYVTQLHRRKFLIIEKKNQELYANKMHPSKVKAYSLSMAGRVVLNAWSDYRQALERSKVDG